MSRQTSSILDPTSHNVEDPGSFKRQTKGTPNDASAQFNHLPPGDRIENTPTAVDVKRDAKLSPKAPLLSSSQKYGS